MKNVLYKTFGDIEKLINSFIVGILLTGSFVSLVAGYLQRKEVPLVYILYWGLSVLVIFSVTFGIRFLINLFLWKTVNKNIFVKTIESSKKPTGRILLHIINDNDDDMKNIRVELKHLFLDKINGIEITVNADNNCFSKGLSENNNTILANTSSKVQVAENKNGLLTLLLEDEFESDYLQQLKEKIKRQSYCLLIKISAKVGSILFKKEYEFVFSHWMDDTAIIDHGPVARVLPRYLSGIEWGR